VGGKCRTLATILLEKRPGTHHTGEQVGPRACLDRCRKSHPRWGLNPKPSSLQWVSIPTTQSQLPLLNSNVMYYIQSWKKQGNALSTIQRYADCLTYDSKVASYLRMHSKCIQNATEGEIWCIRKLFMKSVIYEVQMISTHRPSCVPCFIVIMPVSSFSLKRTWSGPS
jgi:hypothetical protein